MIICSCCSSMVARYGDSSLWICTAYDADTTATQVALW